MSSIKNIIELIKGKGICNDIYRFLLIAILLLVTIFSYITYSFLSSNLYEDAKNEKQGILNNSKDTIDLMLGEVYKEVIGMSVDYELQGFIQNPDIKQSNNVTYIVSRLNSIKNSNPFIHSIYLYMGKNNIILTSEEGWWNTYDFYDMDWKNFFTEKSGDFIYTDERTVETLDKKRESVISFIRPLPSNSADNLNQNAFVVNIYVKDIEQILSKSLGKDEGYAYILDQGNGTIVKYGNVSQKPGIKNSDFNINPINQKDELKDNLQEGKLVIFKTSSNFNKWDYIVLIPKNSLLSKTSRAKMVFVIFYSLSIILAVFSTFIILKGMYTPLRKFIQKIENKICTMNNLQIKRKNQNEIEFIDECFNGLLSINRKMEEKIRNESITLFESICENIFLGDTSRIQELNENDVKGFSFSNFKILIVMIDSLNVHLKESLRQYWRSVVHKILELCKESLLHNSNLIAVKFNDDKIVLIIEPKVKDNKEYNEELFTVVKEVQKKLKNELNVSTTLALSDRNSGIKNLYRAYKQAQYALRNRFIEGAGSILDFNIVKNSKNVFYGFDKQKEEIFINNLRNENVSEAKIIFKKLCYEVRKSENLKYESVFKFLNDIVHLIHFVMEEKRAKMENLSYNTLRLKLNKVMETSETIDEAEDSITGLLDEIITTEKSIISSDTNEITNKIIKYIDKNFDKEINLSKLAAEVFLSPSYLSKLFKQETGYSYMQYLTKKRVQKAKEMLQNPDYKISDVARELSCGNVQNFIRMFKIYEGMTPGQYRGLFVKNNLDSEQNYTEA